MNCPKCGKQIKGFRCEGCGFHLKNDVFVHIGDSKDTLISGIVEYIRNEDQAIQKAKDEQEKREAEEITKYKKEIKDAVRREREERAAVQRQQKAEEKKRQEAEEAERRKQAAKVEQEEARRRLEEAEQRRQAAEARWQQEEEERRRREAEARRQREEEERRRREAEARRQREEEERRRREAEARRQEEEERRRREAEARRQQEEEERRRREAEARRQQEEARRRREAEARRQREAEITRRQRNRRVMIALLCNMVGMLALILILGFKGSEFFYEYIYIAGFTGLAALGIYLWYADVAAWTGREEDLWTSVAYILVGITAGTEFFYWNAHTTFWIRLHMISYALLAVYIFSLTTIRYLVYLRLDSRLQQNRILWETAGGGIGIALLLLMGAGAGEVLHNMIPYGVGDVLAIGRYEQDGDETNGAEPLMWEIKETEDGKALLICETCIEALPYNAEGTSNTWTDSTIRSWLNQDFYAVAFSSAEQPLITETTITTMRLSEEEGHHYGETYGEGETTQDKLFLPDMTQFYMLTGEPEVSDYARTRFQAVSIYGPEDSQLMFWIRSPYGEDNRNYACGYTDSATKDYIFFSTSNALVRPAMYIDLEAYSALQEELKGDASGQSGETDLESGAVDEEAEKAYYRACLEELNAGMESGSYKQVLFGRNAVYCVNQDGTITVYGAYKGTEEESAADYSSWTDIDSIVLEDGYSGYSKDVLAGLRPDGTIQIKEGAYSGKADVSGWSEISMIDLPWEGVLGLQKDGTLLLTPSESESGEETYLASAISGIRNCRKVVSVETKDTDIVLLMQDGTVTGVGGGRLMYHDAWAKPYESWSDIQDIAACSEHTDLFGLTGSGTIVYGGVFGSDGTNLFDEDELASWRNITAISAGGSHLAALQSDGTVLAAGKNGYGQCDVEGWSDIVRIEAYNYTTVGYAADGTIRMTGYNCLEQWLSD